VGRVTGKLVPFLTDLSFLKDVPDPLPSEVQPPEGDRLRRTLPAAPTRSTVRRRRVAALGVSLAWLCCHLALFGLREDVRQLPAGYLVAQVGLPVLLGASCLVVALAPGKLGLGLGVSLIAGMALLGPISFWLLALGVPVPHSPEAAPSEFWPGTLLCLDITLSWAAVPLLLVALSLRRTFAAHAPGRSALVGAGLGLLSGGTINLHCDNVDRWHMAMGHGAPVLVAAFLGALLVARWTRA
jgi:hypothetical protein